MTPGEKQALADRFERELEEWAATSPVVGGGTLETLEAVADFALSIGVPVVAVRAVGDVVLVDYNEHRVRGQG